MKIIFLDMDGVLCTTRSHIAQDQRGLMEALDREAVGLLNRLAEVPGEDVRFVLSSTWRLIHDRGWMEEHLRKFGWRGQFHDDWRTIELTDVRGTEVEDWLHRHFEVTSFVILDDDADFLPRQMPRLVRTEFEDGLRWCDFLEANRLLHGDKHAWRARRPD